MAALGVSALPLATAQAQLVYTRADWKFADFDSLLRHSARAKQVYDIRPIGDGQFLNNIKNSLNGLHFGFSIPADAVKVV